MTVEMSMVRAINRYMKTFCLTDADYQMGAFYKRGDRNFKTDTSIYCSIEISKC